MALTAKDREKLVLQSREKLRQLAKNIGDNEIISCEDLRVLEQAVFDFVPVKLDYAQNIPRNYRGKTVYFKYIALDGYTLRKLDLSEVSFDDVVWVGRKDNNGRWYGFEGWLYDLLKEEEQKSKIKYSEHHIDFSHTNAKIDLTQSALTKYFGLPVCVYNVDFSGTDLSNNKLHSYIFCNSNISSTGIQFEFPIKTQFKNDNSYILINDLLPVYGRPYAILEHCNCDNLDTFLKWPKMDYGFFNYHNSRKTRVCGYDSSFRNCGLKLIVPTTEEDYEDYNRHDIKECATITNEALKNDLLVGCYLNGSLILTNKEREANARAEHQRQIDNESQRIEGAFKVHKR